MITYLAATRQRQLGSRKLLRSCVPEIAEVVQVSTYDDIFRNRSLDSGTYIFSDLDRLAPDETERAEVVWNTLSRHKRGVRLLNRPSRSMRRYELLRTLYEQGINDFNVYRLTEARRPKKFPVFVRGENDHRGSLTPLLFNQAQLDEAIDSLIREGVSRENKIIVEFCDTADANGRHHRFGAFIVGDQIFPRSALYSRQWMVKSQSMDYTDLGYIEENPHVSLLRPIFETAGIEYGRMDYALVDGNVRVFEINMNPSLFNPDCEDPDVRLTNETFAKKYGAAMRSINLSEDSSLPIPLEFPERFGYRWRFPRVRRAIHRVLHALDLLEYEEQVKETIKKAWGSLFQVRLGG